MRGSTYLMAAALVCRCEVTEVRRLVRRQRRPGQARIHFCKMGNPARTAFLGMVATTNVRIISATARGRRTMARSECWSRLVPRMIQLCVSEIVIETADGVEQRDRSDLGRALANVGADRRIRYRHAAASSEPLLWIADAVAWSLGRGGIWAQRVWPLIC